MTQESAVLEVVGPLTRGFKKATAYFSQTLTIKGTRLHRPRNRERGVTMVLTIGKPNYAEREFIKVAKKAGEPFPIERVQLKSWPKEKR